MAFSYISAATKLDIEERFNNIHETFGREITIYQSPVATVIASSPTYNHLYRKNVLGADGATYTPRSETFKARVKYLAQAQDVLTGANDQQKIFVPAGSVKIKVNLTAEAYLKEGKRVEFDGRKFEVISLSRPIGMFSPQYAVFILKPIDE